MIPDGVIGHVYRYPSPSSITFEPGSVKVEAEEVTIADWTVDGPGADLAALQRHAIEWAIERLEDALTFEGPAVPA